MVTVTNTVTVENTEAVYEKFNVLIICKKIMELKFGMQWPVTRRNGGLPWKPKSMTDCRIKRICKT